MTFGAGLELTVVLLGHPLVVPLVLPVVAVGDGELPPEPDPIPGMVPQAASMQASAMTSETTIKKDLRWRMCTVRIRVTPYITIFLTSCALLINAHHECLYYLNVFPREKVPTVLCTMNVPVHLCLGLPA